MTLTMERLYHSDGRYRICRILFFLLIFVREGSAAMGRIPDETAGNLPKTIDGWTRTDSPRRISAKTIFDYMDGAGELYLGYRFKHLDVYEYSSPDEDQILVELYWMESADDAFGLLSGDWGGDAAELGQEQTARGEHWSWPGKRAIYGGGLLRIWSGDLYARIMAYQETTRSKAAVLKLGRVIAAGRKNPAPPRLLSALPQSSGAGFKLRADRVCFFRSHLVLNSVYFLSTGNIIELAHSSEAVTASYARVGRDGNRESAQLLLVRYHDPEAASRARAHFESVYLPEKQAKPAGAGDAGGRQFRKIEDGWLGYDQRGRTMAFIFECPSRESAAQFVEEAIGRLETLEDTHE